LRIAAEPTMELQKEIDAAHLMLHHRRALNAAEWLVLTVQIGVRKFQAQTFTSRLSLCENFEAI
jgi:hypothetical protein